MSKNAWKYFADKDDVEGECDPECDYKSWQKSFYIASSTEFVAAAFFLATACFVVKDWDKAIEDEKGKIVNFVAFV